MIITDVTTSKNKDWLHSSWSTPTATSEMWYPAAGNQPGNEVEEPNQLGWKKPNNSASILSEVPFFLYILLYYLFLN